MNILFVVDPPENLVPKGDSSLMLAEDCARRRHSVSFVEAHNMYFREGELFAHGAELKSLTLGEKVQLHPRKTVNMGSFSHIFIRKDPPFDESYVRLCWFLRLLEEKIKIVESPSVLLKYHEKMIPLEAMADGVLKSNEVIPTYIGPAEGAKVFAQEHRYNQVILKPFLGHGGENVELISKDQFSRLSFDGIKMVQPFIADIETVGDRRVFIVNGKVVGDVMRRPQKGQILSNLSRGGIPSLDPMSSPQKELLERLGKFLKKQNIFFAGVDMIGSKISEVNITSPTTLWAYKELSGINLATKIIDEVEKL